jgi:hypothetical protein
MVWVQLTTARAYVWGADLAMNVDGESQDEGAPLRHHGDGEVFI